MSDSTPTDPDLGIPPAALRRTVLLLRAIDHTLRRRMIALLDREGRLKVTDIFIALRLEQSVTSQHLSILRKAHLVTTQREGKFIYYALNEHRLSELRSVISRLQQSEPPSEEEGALE
jgi:DNA-binding transcriptional ArsR family regulator